MLTWSIYLGKVWGIRLYLHWSLFVTLGLICALLAESALPAAYPGRSIVVYWSVGALAAVIFVLSLAAHSVVGSGREREQGVDESVDVEGVVGSGIAFGARVSERGGNRCSVGHIRVTCSCNPHGEDRSAGGVRCPVCPYLLGYPSHEERIGFREDSIAVLPLAEIPAPAYSAPPRLVSGSATDGLAVRRIAVTITAH